MKIDRKRVVRRHNPRYREMNTQAPLSVGNGEFACSVDITGLQSLYTQYDEVPLCIQSQWAWHSWSRTEALSPDRSDLAPVMVETPQGRKPYYISNAGQEEEYDWLRKNPHRPNLAKLSLRYGKDSESLSPEEVDQELDLYSGIIRSRFSDRGNAFSVRTACHPYRDILCTEITCSREESYTVGISFPYGDPGISGSDWNRGTIHSTRVAKRDNNRLILERVMDNCRYFVKIDSNGTLLTDGIGMHEIVLSFPQGGEPLTITCSFSPAIDGGEKDSDRSVFEESERHWSRFWERGGIIDLGDSTDSRAGELERRTILSQYLTAVQCSGSVPPQETGLTCNSWFGKFHLEMHYWHAAHFPQWNRPELLARSMPWYLNHRDRAEELALSQGFKGLRWPKMVDSSGYDSPSNIAPLLIWQQPHPIMFAELIYRARPDRDVLDLYAPLVQGSAEFMADFASPDGKGRYCLGPGLIPAQENHPYRMAMNPTFELEYWKFGLETANLWRQRRGLPPEPRWEDICRNLARPSSGEEGYWAHEQCPGTYTDYNYDHPSMMCALGMLPGKLIDRSAMKRTLDSVKKYWRYDRLWGWDFPVMAMTAARLGDAEQAVDFLLAPGVKNIYLPNGHNRQEGRKDLPLYLPGNGGFLIAMGMMAAGWDGADAVSPGFPKNRNWQVLWEDILPIV